MLDPVGRRAAHKAAAGKRGAQFAQHIAARAHLGGVPVRKLAFIHLEAVVVLGHRHDIARARLHEQVGPGGGVKVFGPEPGDKIFVAEIPVRAPGLDMVFIGRAALDVHVAGVPFVFKGRHGVSAPVDEDAELGVAEPARRAVVLQRVPTVLIRAARDDGVDLAQLLLLLCGEHGVPPAYAAPWAGRVYASPRMAATARS